MLVPVAELPRLGCEEIQGTKRLLQDKLIEAFAEPHDYIGGKRSELYDEQGNIKQGMTVSPVIARRLG